MHLNEWTEKNPIKDEMLWKKSALGQLEHLGNFAAILGGEPYVVNTHRSKSIILPVIEVRTPYGVRVFVRDNFYDIKVSVEAPRPCDNDLFGLLAGGDGYLAFCYFEGFQDEWIHPPFVLGAEKFSVSSNWDEFLSLAKALRWYFDGQNAELLKGDELISKETVRRFMAEAGQLPMLFHPATVSGLYRFFETAKDIEPNEGRLREALTRQGPGYDGKVSDKPLPYVDLDFSAGCPKPVDAWLTVLDKLIQERRVDPKADRLGGDLGVRVNVYRLTEALKNRAQELGLKAILVPPDNR